MHFSVKICYLEGMKAEWINPFIVATRDTFDRMMRLKVSNGKPYLLSAEMNTKDISGMIGLSGSIRGAVVIGFPTDSALRIVNTFMQENFTKLGPDVSDAVGEIANIIAGYVKKFIPTETIDISLPSVVRGEKHMVQMPKDSPVLVIPFESEQGTFVLEVAMRSTSGS